MTSPFSLDGKAALVTGGNQGLGKAFALGLAQAGARVAIAGRRPDANTAAVEEARAAGHELVPLTADITRDDQVAAMTEAAVAALGTIDVLVNNAGICYHAPSFEVTDEQWTNVFDLNVRALWKTSLAVGAVMRERRSGSIVNIGSMSGIIVNRPQWQPAYNASKAAVHHLDEVAGRGVGALRDPGQRRRARLREDRHGTGGPARVPQALDRRRPAAALRDARGDRAERRLPRERRGVVHHGFDARHRRRLHGGLNPVPVMEL